MERLQRYPRIDPDARELANKFASNDGLSDLEPIGSGLEFAVFRANAARYRSASGSNAVALRVPKHLVFENANDPGLDARALLRQELDIYELLAKQGKVPVPHPHAFLEAEGYPAMVSEFVRDDGSVAGPAEMGRVAAQIHCTQLPDTWRSPNSLVAQEGLDTLVVLPRRMARRFRELGKIVPEADAWAVPEEMLLDIAAGLAHLPRCLLHMDFRTANFRVREGRIAAVVDWENALIGPAVVDLYRILELVRPGKEFTEAYWDILPVAAVSEAEELLLRLDAQLMLSLVFMSEAPDPDKAGPAVARVQELALRLLKTQMSHSSKSSANS